MNMAIVLLSGIFISYFAVCVYGTIKKNVGSEERKKRKRGEMNTEEKEKGGWNE